MKKSDLNIVHDLSTLYELSLAAASFQDFEENCSRFLKIFMSRKNLTSAFYFKFLEFERNGAACFSIAIPKKAFNCELVIKKERLTEIFDGANSKIFNETSTVLSRLLNQRTEHALAYFMENSSLLVLTRNSLPFSKKEETQLENVVRHFFNFNDGLLSKEQLELQNLEMHQYIRSNIQLQNFASIASHDLKSPLRTIHSFSQILSENLVEHCSTKEAKYFKIIEDSTSSMFNLIDDLLSFSKVDREKLKVEKVAPRKLIEGIIERMQRDIVEQKAKVHLDQLPKEIYCDVLKFNQLFQNLIANAIKFNQKDTPPEIRISAYSEEGNWHFEIADNGVGIESQYLTKIFEMFHSLNKSPKNSTGIGLATCKRIIEIHNGKIWVVSELNRGSVFHLVFPKYFAKNENSKIEENGALKVRI